MEGTSQTGRGTRSERRFRDQSEPANRRSVEVDLSADGPLEVNMTDEPGGDPYNHTGRFERMYR